MREAMRGKNLFDIAAFASRATRRESRSPPPIAALSDYDLMRSSKRLPQMADPRLGELEKTCEALRAQVADHERWKGHIDERLRAHHSELLRLNDMNQQFSAFSTAMEGTLCQTQKSALENTKRVTGLENKTAQLFDELKEAILALGQRTLFLEDRCNESLKATARAEEKATRAEETAHMLLKEFERRVKTMCEAERAERLRTEQLLVERLSNQIPRLWETTEGAMGGLQVLDQRQKEMEEQNLNIISRIASCEKRVTGNDDSMRTVNQHWQTVIEDQHRLARDDCASLEHRMTDLFAKFEQILEEEVKSRMTADHQLHEFTKGAVEALYRDLATFKNSAHEARKEMEHLQIKVADGQRQSIDRDRTQKLQDEIQFLEQKIAKLTREISEHVSQVEPLVRQQNNLALDLRRLEKEAEERSGYLTSWMQEQEREMAILRQTSPQEFPAIADLKQQLRSCHQKIENCANFSLEGLKKLDINTAHSIEHIFSIMLTFSEKLNAVISVIGSLVPSVEDHQFGIELVLQTIFIMRKNNQRNIEECYSSVQDEIKQKVKTLSQGIAHLERQVPYGIVSLARCIGVSAHNIKSLSFVVADLLTAINLQRYGLGRTLQCFQKSKDDMENIFTHERVQQKEQFYALNKDFQYLIGWLKTTQSMSSLLGKTNTSIEHHSL